MRVEEKWVDENKDKIVRCRFVFVFVIKIKKTRYLKRKTFV